MTALPAAWSYSRLDGFEVCPKQFHAKSIAKTLKEPESEHQTYGKEVHLSFAHFLTKDKLLPLHLRHWTKLLTQIKAAPGEKIVEQKICINASYEPVDWFAKDAWCRVISDCTILNGARGALFDWKTGKVSDDFTQLKIAAAVVMLLAPEVESLDLAYVWLKTKQVTRDRLLRADATKVWADLMPRLARYQYAFDNLEFPPRPGDPQCGWCHLTSCPYNKKKQR